MLYGSLGEEGGGKSKIEGGRRKRESKHQVMVCIIFKEGGERGRGGEGEGEEEMREGKGKGEGRGGKLATVHSPQSSHLQAL